MGYESEWMRMVGMGLKGRQCGRMRTVSWSIAGLLLLTLLANSRRGVAQVGTGAPDASARMQREREASEFAEKNAKDAAPPKYPGQALDVDSRALGKVPADPLIDDDTLHRTLKPLERGLDKLKRTDNISFSASYTLLDQYATATPDGARHNVGGGRLDLVGGWKLYDHETNAGTLSVLVRSGTNIGVSQQYNLSNALGSALVLNALQGGAQQDPISLNVLYYRQDFWQKKVAFYVGKIHPNEYISLSLYNNDERSQFLNAENDGNLTIPSDGTYAGGAALEYQMSKHLYMHAVTVDTEGSETSNLKTLVDKKYMNAIEFGWKKGAPTQQEHLFRFVLWRDDTKSLGSGAGAGFGTDYELKSGWVPFGRLGVATDAGNNIKRVLDVGIVNIRPFGRRGDMFGAALNLTDPSHTALHHESQFETFYRVRMTRSLEIGPDLEVDIHPTNAKNAYSTALLGLRARITL
jgi:porin